MCQQISCGTNAKCRVSHETAFCSCLPEFYGNPYEGCRPECVIHSDCALNQACVHNKCQDPCPGTCGFNAVCYTINHIPSCNCQSGYNGDPFTRCDLIEQYRKFSNVLKYFLFQPINSLSYNNVFSTAIARPTDPCDPSPCGPNSQCLNTNGKASCTCLVNYKGTPPNCRPECVVSTECPINRACMNQKCVDPCPNVCGIDARCESINHSPICSCGINKTGDPFVRCFDITRKW